MVVVVVVVITPQVATPVPVEIVAPVAQEDWEVSPWPHTLELIACSWVAEVEVAKATTTWLRQVYEEEGSYSSRPIGYGPRATVASVAYRPTAHPPVMLATMVPVVAVPVAR